MKPAAFNYAYHCVGGRTRNGRAALTALDFVAEQEEVRKYLGIRGTCSSLRGFRLGTDGHPSVVRDECGERVSNRKLERVGIFHARGAERRSFHGLANDRFFSGQRQADHRIRTIERVGRGAKDGHIVVNVHGNDRGFHEAGWRCSWVGRRCEILTGRGRPSVDSRRG